MPKAKRKAREERDQFEIDPSPRDFVMARIAAGRAAAQSAVAAIDDLLNLFVNPDDDKRGKERVELLGEALEALGCACRAVEMAEATIDQIEFTECEPWDEGASEEDEEEEEDEDDEED